MGGVDFFPLRYFLMVTLDVGKVGATSMDSTGASKELVLGAGAKDTRSCYAHAPILCCLSDKQQCVVGNRGE